MGMDPRLGVTREDWYNLQMEVKQVQYVQNSHTERIVRLEKRQAEDASLKSVWNSPFPGVLSGTPQHGPVAHNDMFDDLDEQGEELLGSLHLGPAEEEPARRGAASRANSVRFDESALHGSSWAGHNNRHSGDFGPARPGSGLMMERSLSHKSDGRHSSAGHSVHSHYSAPSGRASSLGLDTNFAVDDDDDDSLDIPEPPASFYVLGTVPSIVRCWLTTNFAHRTLLYADVCTGSQKSTVDYSLLQELDLVEEIQRAVDGTFRVRLNVYFAEAVVAQHARRSASPERPVPSMTVLFEVVGVEGSAAVESPGIRIYIGSDALRAHSADVLFSQNTMVLYGDDRSRLRVPFVRPEDDACFRHICTTHVVPEKPKLNATAAPFVLGETASGNSESGLPANEDDQDDGRHGQASPPSAGVAEDRGTSTGTLPSDHEAESDRSAKHTTDAELSGKESSTTPEASRKETSTGIWASWRNASGSGPDGRENGLLSGYQPPARGSRGMKILKSQKSSSVRAVSSYEPPAPSKGGNEGRRKSHGQASASGDHGLASSSPRWDSKRSAGALTEVKTPAQNANRESRNNSQSLPRSANPVGGASAFSWMAPPGKSKPPTTAGE